jgi:hypothetical protein
MVKVNENVKSRIRKAGVLAVGIGHMLDIGVNVNPAYALRVRMDGSREEDGYYPSLSNGIPR